MGASVLHPKCFENSRELEMLPMTRNLDGLWGSVMMPSWELSGVRTEHQTCRGGKKVRKEKKNTFLHFVESWRHKEMKVNQLVHSKAKVLFFFLHSCLCYQVSPDSAQTALASQKKKFSHNSLSRTASVFPFSMNYHLKTWLNNPIIERLVWSVCRQNRRIKTSDTSHTNLCKSHKEQLMVAQSQRWQRGLLAVLLYPVHVSLWKEIIDDHTSWSNILTIALTDPQG